MLRQPPHILVTTRRSRCTFCSLRAKARLERLAVYSTIIVDEIHAVADDKRGSHLALTLERLEALVCSHSSLIPASPATSAGGHEYRGVPLRPFAPCCAGAFSQPRHKRPRPAKNRPFGHAESD